jgi:sulfonate transport system permease protein
MSTQTIAQNKAISIKKKKTQLTKSYSVWRGLSLPVFVLILWQLLSSINILSAQLFSSP